MQHSNRRHFLGKVAVLAAAPMAPALAAVSVGNDHVVYKVINRPTRTIIDNNLFGKQSIYDDVGRGMTSPIIFHTDESPYLRSA